ncbi:CDGSH iron-sulfur domain-containing protein [Kribbella capetownensis]|uniref:CDGSH iron-sulfur domain-containing protein n=1 Tax=Kribbella capetownensis TaxID=1572659 RepID=A0A4R0JYI9_9ACTN|nr:CDGSH iron-sulfur domain-containing protein [Kribbella capetownensis]TCC47455.1 CDGSH iron-sulfur domain-containing protein [Kribbella capetownensis]
MSISEADQPDRVTIRAYPNGPLLVRGPVELRDEHGEPIDSARATIALCRCGRSSIKPLCDGTHAINRKRKQ